MRLAPFLIFLFGTICLLSSCADLTNQDKNQLKNPAETPSNANSPEQIAPPVERSEPKKPSKSQVKKKKDTLAALKPKSA